MRYTSTTDFIHVCYRSRKQRIGDLAAKIGSKEGTLDPYKNSIHEIMDFIKKIDLGCHRYEKQQPYTALSQTFHAIISSDLRSLIILAITQQNFQMNIVLRHFIESFIVSIWVDIGSQFTGGFYDYLETEKWKPYWDQRGLRITWLQIQKRLQVIRDLNEIKEKTFYKTYFKTANDRDFTLLLSLPICEKCREDKPKIMYRRYQTGLITRIRTQKVDRKAIYKTGSAYICNFCSKQKPIKGYVMGIPDIYDMIEMLKVVASNTEFITNIDILKRVYGHLSSEFVHFGTSILPDKEPHPAIFGMQNNAIIWGVEGVAYCLNALRPLADYYFRKLRSEIS